MTTSAAVWVRFTRLIPLNVAPNLPYRAAREHVTTLHQRGWTADDIAHAVVVGINGADKPALVVAARLRDLVAGNVPPPVDPTTTPTPPPYNPELRGPGTEQASDWAVRIRSELAHRRTQSRSQESA